MEFPRAEPWLQHCGLAGRWRTLRLQSLCAIGVIDTSPLGYSDGVQLGSLAIGQWGILME